MTETKRAIEAVLMAAIEPIEPQLLAQLTETPVDEIEALCTELHDEYERDGRGFTLVKIAGGYRYQTHADMAPYIERFVLDGQSARLSGPALETLAIIAYKQPVSRAQLSAIRGVNVESTIATLIQRGYVAEIGHDPGPGQAILYGTTTRFLEQVGLDSLQELPPLADFVPEPEVVEALERGLHLRVDDANAAAAADGDDVRRRARTPSTSPTSERRPRERRPVDDDGVRLQKVLAEAGIGSRRVCEELIVAGRVTRRRRGRGRSAGGSIPRPRRSRSTVCRSRPAPGSSTTCSTSRSRVISTAHDPRGAPDGRRPGAGRAAGVSRSAGSTGDTEGLLLLTNDGDLTHRLTHPSFGVEKEYLAEVDGVPTRAALRRLREGVELDDGADRAGPGARSRPAAARAARRSMIVIHEGRNRQVRRMCEAVGHPVRRLVRTRIGPIADRDARAGGVAHAHRAPRCGRSMEPWSPRAPGSLARR